MSTPADQVIERLEQLERAAEEAAASGPSGPDGTSGAPTDLAAIDPELAAELSPNADWRRLLRTKLLPQLRLPPCLVIAVVGGTNVGKSLLFNHLLGETAAAITSRAAGTRHPTAAVAAGLAKPELLSALLPGFKLDVREDVVATTEDDGEHRLFWRLGPRLPPEWILLDTPDINADIPANWERAERIRLTADVLLAVLTPQTYNDAAVKRFFRKGADEGKTVVLLLNLCNPEEDRPDRSDWLTVFRAETGVNPAAVLLSPRDRDSAAAGKANFLRAEAPTAKPSPDLLREALAAIEPATARLAGLQGALQAVLGPAGGATRAGRVLRSRAEVLTEIAATLQALLSPEVRWPTAPTVIRQERFEVVRRAHRPPWSARILWFYRGAANLLRRPREWLFGKGKSPAAEAENRCRQAELTALHGVAQGIVTAWRELAEKPSPLREDLRQALSGDRLRNFIDRICAPFDSGDVLPDRSPQVDEAAIATAADDELPARVAVPWWFERAEAIWIGLRPIGTLTVIVLGFWSASSGGVLGGILLVLTIVGGETFWNWAWEATYAALCGFAADSTRGDRLRRNDLLQIRLAETAAGTLARSAEACRARTEKAARKLDDALAAARLLCGPGAVRKGTK